MILSVSRRTDIPAFYGDWFINRLKEGFVYVRNPMNPRQVSKIALSPEKIDCIVFWTKNPAEKFISDLSMVDDMGYKYYFQYAINSYNHLVEKNIPKKQFQLERFQRISSKIGKERVVWRYDPIFFTEYYDLEYHKKWFAYIASKLENHTEKCVISFLDFYTRIKKRLEENSIQEVTEEQMCELSFFLSEIASDHGIKLETCCEKIDLSKAMIMHGHCIDGELVSLICGKRFDLKKDKNQRDGCGCAESIDIGAYNTCRNGCVYCYANWHEDIEVSFDPESPVLCSVISSEDKITERVVYSCQMKQPVLF